MKDFRCLSCSKPGQCCGVVIIIPVKGQASINLELSVSFHDLFEHLPVHIPPYQRSLTQDRKVLFKG
jgi:hypothetical protein